MSDDYYNYNGSDDTYGGSGSSFYRSPGVPPEKDPKDSGTLSSPLKRIGVSALSALVFGVIAAVVFLGVTNFGMSKLGKDQTVNESSQAVTEQQEQEEEEEVPSISDDSVEESEKEKPVITGSGIQNAVVSPGGTLTTTEVVDECMPAMVSITGMSVQQVQSFFGTQEYEAGIAGSGIIVGKTDEELLIATNQHVVEDTNSLTVTFVDENSVEAVIKGQDARNDLAIVSVPLSNISKETLDAISVIKMGDSTTLKAGEEVVAIGNALGYGQSVSRGIISTPGRESDIGGSKRTLIQTDAAINPGNSGGALINMKGELIGINEAKDVGTEIEGVGYAIPISEAWPILENLMEGETRVKVDESEAGYIGIAQSFSIDENRAKANSAPEGVYVQYLIDGGAAAKAGIKPGDIITTLNGTGISTMEELKEELSYYKAGETVSVTLYRYGDNGYEEMSFDVTLMGAESLENGVGEVNGDAGNNNGDAGNNNGNAGSGDIDNGGMPGSEPGHGGNNGGDTSGEYPEDNGSGSDRPERPDWEGGSGDNEFSGGLDDLFNYFFGR